MVETGGTEKTKTLLIYIHIYVYICIHIYTCIYIYIQTLPSIVN